MTAIFVFLLRVYQRTLSRVLVLLLGPLCRFTPSCSEYAIACLKSHGVLRGSLLSVGRVCRCHPFHPGGYDPPPPPPDTSPDSSPDRGLPTNASPTEPGRP